MAGLLQRSRIWAWGGWLVAGLLVLGLLALGALSSGSARPAFAPVPQMVVQTQVASMPVEGVGGAGEAAGALDSAVALPERLIIRTGSITMVVDNTRTTQTAIEQLVGEMAVDGAFVVSSSEYGGSGDQQPSINVAIRVPAARFDEVMDRLAAMAVEVLSRNESGQDVTEEYVDLQARVETLEAARKRLLGLMENAPTTEELLMAEQQLTQREAEIESIKGRMQYLQQSARLSSIAVELRPYVLSQPIDVRWRPAEDAREAYEAFVERLQGFGSFLIFFIIADLPWIIFFGLVVFGVVRLGMWWRARRAKQKPPAQSPAEQSNR